MDSEDFEALVADLALRHAIEDFILQEVALLDDGKLSDWIRLFSEDGFYWIAESPAQESPFDGATPFYGNVAAIESAFPRRPDGMRSVRSVTNIRIENRNPKLGAFEVSAVFLLAERRRDEEDGPLAGRYDYALLRSGDGFRIAAKRAVTVSGEGAGRERDYPL